MKDSTRWNEVDQQVNKRTNESLKQKREKNENNKWKTVECIRKWWMMRNVRKMKDEWQIKNKLMVGD